MVSLVSDLGGDICDGSFHHSPHPMKACITGVSGLGLLVNRARRSEGVFECLVKTVSREMEKSGDLTVTRRPLRKSPFQGSSGSYE